MRAKTFLEPPISVGKPYLAGPIGDQRWHITFNKKPIKYARYLMQQFIGRKLNSDEVVHHINHNQLDDRIENLQITSHKEHGNHHNPKILKPCLNCGILVKKKPSRLLRSPNTFCSRKCLGRFRYKQTPIRPCDWCSKKIRVIMFRIHRDKTHFCNSKCKYSFKSKHSHLA